MSAEGISVLWQTVPRLDNSHLDGYLRVMTDYTVAEAKNQLPKLLKRALAGEAVVITRRGKPIARITPMAELPATGIDLEWLKSVQIKPADRDFDGQEIIRLMKEEDPY
jgi:prevent-host-death family protein